MPDDNKISDNMRIWDQVCEVPEAVCKSFHPNGDTSKTLTAVAPIHYFKVATELWGPIGDGWGFEIVEEGWIQDEKGKPILHTMRVKLWYGGRNFRVADDGSAIEIESLQSTYGTGCTQMQYLGPDGKLHWDDEVNKKSLTDAITNALSRLGFGADIRLQRPDDLKYADRDPANGNGSNDWQIRVAWTEYCAWVRKMFPDRAQDKSDAQIIQRAMETLKEKSRPETPDHIRDLMKLPGS